MSSRKRKNARARPPSIKCKKQKKKATRVLADFVEESSEEEEPMADDEMQNAWGVEYCLVYNSTRRGRETKAGFNNDIGAEVPGFQLETLAASGTTANTMAMNLASDFNHDRVLTGIGSYVGGDACLQAFSTSAYSAKGKFAMPCAFEDATEKAKRQTAILPYLLDCDEYDQASRVMIEDECLNFLHRKLLFAQMIGKPYKVLLLEYILGGCGAELSDRFLSLLGPLLEQFGVSVIADEILTGGRVGPTMCMTTQKPTAFLKVVKYITLGKWPNCGIVLARASTKPTTVGDQPLRGYSTEWNLKPASAAFAEVCGRMKDGSLEARHKQTLKLLKVEGKREQWWGKGLLLFSSYTRNPVMKGLKNRVLPRLDKTKLIKLNARRTEWTRSAVCREVVQTSKQWIAAQEKVMQQSKFVFIDALVSFILAKPGCASDSDESWSAKDDEALHFRPNDIVDHLGAERVEAMASVARACIEKEDGRRCTKKATALIKQAISTSIRNGQSPTNQPADAIIYKKRKGYARVEYTFVNQRFLLHHNKSPSRDHNN